MKTIFSIFCLFMLVAFSGCGPDLSHLPATVNASGVVTLDGKPVDKADVTFISEVSDYHATAISDAQGQFTLNAFTEKEGAVPGKYRVEVNKTIVGASAENEEGGEGATVNVSFGLPKKYASLATSGLVAEIPESGISDLKLELKSK